MDQYPFEFTLHLLMEDILELYELLETDKERWGWLVDEMNRQWNEQLTNM